MPSTSQQWRHDPEDVRRRLAQLGGLTIEILHEAAIEGEMGRANCTSNHPPLAGPFNAYADATRSLRDQLLPMRWVKSNSGGQALTISPDGIHAIIVAAGDEHTGSQHFSPKTKSPKGPCTQRAVASNMFQTTFLAELGYEEIAETVLVRRAENPAALTWILLVARFEDVLHVELSLPVRIGDDGRPELWPERIILPSIDLDGGSRGVRRGPEPGPDFEVEVTRLNA